MITEPKSRSPAFPRWSAGTIKFIFRSDTEIFLRWSGLRAQLTAIPTDEHIAFNGYEQNSAQFDVKPRPIWHRDKKLMPSSHPGVNADTRRVSNVSG
ncbi:hypothetical protein [Desulfobulbus sp.]|uniref:hypothetical protein n=1 Tax=Desulfobulbus sp. TaxID=895 RepID=UPI0027BA991C|nr:hypothetical protein [Desulfobulbus sp.]